MRALVLAFQKTHTGQMERPRLFRALASSLRRVQVRFRGFRIYIFPLTRGIVESSFVDCCLVQPDLLRNVGLAVFTSCQ
jgi:hypothetical protein